MESGIDEEIIKEYLSPRKEVPVLKHRNELKKFLVALIHYCEKSKNLNDEKEASSYLRSNLFIDNVIKTAKGLQTHNTKIPDANRPLPGPFYRNTKFKDERFVYSGTTNLKRKLFWSGNAAELGKKHFLTAQFIYQGKLTSISEEFYFSENETSDVILILDELGLSKEHKEALKMSIFKSIDNNPTYVVDPQILWPLENGKYMCITPVISCGMQREIWHRKEPFKEGMFREFETIGIAGANPGNAGDLSSSIVGKFKLLKAGIPKINSKENETIWKIIFKRKTAFNSSVFDGVVFSEYLKLLDEERFHFTYINKLKIEEDIEELISISLQLVLDIHCMVHFKKQNIPQWVKNKLNSAEIAFYLDTNVKNIAYFAIFCTEILKTNANHRNDFMTYKLNERVSNLFSEYLGDVLL
jgi:hypothetical protein